MAAVVQVIEDSRDVRWLVAFHLREIGFTVRTPDDWPALLELDAWEGVDVAVVDLHLGDPQINGVHILCFLRDELPHIRRVMFTASLEDEADPAFQEAVSLVDAFVSKYDIADELLRAVRG